MSKGHPTSTQIVRRDSGAALIIAIGMLFVISAMGMAYANYMIQNYNKVRYTISVRKAEASSERAIQATISKIGALVRNVEDVPAEFTFESMPLYQGASEGDNPPTVDEDARATAVVTVTDECSRLNLNFAPVRLLQEVLGVDGATARAIRAALPRPGAAMTPEHRWFLHPDELVTRRLLTPEQYANVPVDDLTVYTASNDSDPRGYININTVSPTILSAACGITLEEAEAVAAQRPFTSFQSFIDAVGKDPSTFNVGSGNSEIPRAFALYSRTYRLLSEAGVEFQLRENQWDRLASDRAEAIVQFDEDGKANIVSWRDVSGDL